MDTSSSASKRVRFLLAGSTGAENSSEDNKQSLFEDLLLESSSDEEHTQSKGTVNPTEMKKTKELLIIPKFQKATTSTNTDSSSTDLIRAKIDAFLSEPISDTEEAEIVSIVETNSKNKESTPQEKDMNSNENNEELTVLAMIWQSRMLGGAYYNVTTSELFLLDDVAEDEPGFDVTRVLYRQCQPNHVITVRAGSEKFQSNLKKLVLGESFTNDKTSSSSSPCSSIATPQAVYNELPSKENSYEACYHRVQCLKLESEPSNISSEERLYRLKGLINFKSRSMVHALGLLLKFLDQHWNNIALQPSGNATFISINYVLLEDIVMIAEDVYKILSIMQTRQHPSFCKFGNSAARIEGISLFHLLNRCQSLPGVKALRNMLRTPTRNVKILNGRFDVIEFLMEPNNQNILENLTSSLRDIHRLTTIVLSRFTAPQAKTSEWKKLYKTLSSVIRIADICEMLIHTKPELLKKVSECVTDDMRHIKYFIEYIIDFEASQRMNIISVKPGVDTKLDELFYVNNHMPTLLSEWGEKEKLNTCNLMKKWQLIFVPNAGVLMGVLEWNGSPPEQMQQDFENYEYILSINDVPYYKSPAIKELDNKYGNITLEISKREAQIILRLSRYISNHAASILRSVELCAELDALRSFAHTAQDSNYTRPKVVESQVIDIKQGKHPLLAFMNDVVPNDVYSARDRSLVKIITGPNGCGKSVYLKQVALIVFMAHVGSYVPAESATIGVLTHILIQRPLVDSISLNTSTFFQDIRQINVAVRQSTPNSLVIIDEFGLGTDESSGEALLTAVLSDFIEREERCPHVFVATHIHRVLTLLPRSLLFEAQSLEYIVNDDNTIAFLYQLTSSGHVAGSFAHAAARAAGLEESVVSGALEVYKKLIRGEDIPVSPELQKINASVDRVWELGMLNDPTDIDLEEAVSLVQEIFAPKKEKKT